jgi:uncharacterized SAM-dependent methyltransferase
MHLMSRRRQTVVIDNHEFCFEEGESIRTEHSYKYTLEDFRELAARAGLRVADWWMDERRWFSVHHLVPNQTRSNEESQIEAASQVEAA